MKIFAFLLLTMWLGGCGQGLEPKSEGRVLSGVFSRKPKPAKVFLDEILQNHKLLSNTNRLEREIQRYVKRGGNLNARLDKYGTVMLNEALRKGNESFARLLINNGASVSLALQRLLDPAPTTEGWREVGWFIERGGDLGLLNKYAEKLIKKSGLDSEGMRKAISHGADKEKAFATAIQEKRKGYLEVLTEFVDDQPTFEQAWQEGNYELVEMLLEARKESGKEVDGDELLLRAWRDDKDREFTQLFLYKFGGSEGSIVRKALQEKDYDTLKLTFKIKDTLQRVTLSRLDQWYLLLDVFQTKDAGLIEALLAGYSEESKKQHLDYTLMKVVGVEDYDTAEFIVEQGGDPDIVLTKYLYDALQNIEGKKTRHNVEFNLQRARRMVVMGAEPRSYTNPYPTDLAYQIMQNIDVKAVNATTHELLEFLFEHMDDNKTIKTMARDLLHQLLDAKIETEARVNKLTEYARDNSMKPRELSSRDAFQARDNLINLLRKQGIREDTPQ